MRATSVSIIVPCRNETGYIDAFLDSALAQSLAPGAPALQIVVADGMSDDGTRERLQLRALAEPRIKFIDNPRGITSAALNLAIEAADGAVIVRMDVHTVYASDYVQRCVEALRDSRATCVGGAWWPVGTGWPQAAIAAAFKSRFGSGGAASRRREYTGEVDTVYLGAWPREELLRFGGFDETLVRNQDDELNLRITRGGGRVWQSAAIRSEYHPRASFGALFRQFHQYGYWKVAVIRKHALPASPRHLAPFAFVAGVGVLAVAAPFLRGAALMLPVVLGAYVLLALGAAATLAPPWRHPRDTLGIAWSFACMHVGYGLGFARGVLDFVLRRRAPGDALTRLTR